MNPFRPEPRYYTLSPEPTSEPDRAIVRFRPGKPPPVAHIRIGLISEHDEGTAAAIDQASYRIGAERWSFERFSRHLNVPHITALKAVLRGSEMLLGTLLLAKDKDMTEAKILRLSVHPDWRRRGIGRHLLASIPDHCSTRLRVIVAYVHEMNVRGCRVMFGCGFRVEKLCVGAAGDGRDEIRFTREVEAG